MTEFVQSRRRFQFTIRLVLLVMAMVAASLGIAKLFDEPNPITEAQARQVVVGMAQWQVIKVLGQPHHQLVEAKATRWAYGFAGHPAPDGIYFEVVFDSNGKVSTKRKDNHVGPIYVFAP